MPWRAPRFPLPVKVIPGSCAPGPARRGRHRACELRLRLRRLRRGVQPMTQSDPLLTYIRDARLANHALSAAPAWLWSADATRVLWANAAGAAVLGAASPHALAERRMSAAQPLAAQVMRLCRNLPHNRAPRLERLRGIGAGVGRMVACACSRFALANGMPAILIAAAEAVGPALPFAERVARLFARSQAPIAALA